MHFFKVGLTVIGGLAAVGKSAPASSSPQSDCVPQSFTNTVTHEITVTATSTKSIVAASTTREITITATSTKSLVSTSFLPSPYVNATSAAVATSTTVVTVTKTETTTTTHSVTEVISTVLATNPVTTDIGTTTNVATVVAATSSSTGPYYYSVSNGKTIWVGATPGPSVTFGKTVVTTASIIPFTSKAHHITTVVATATEEANTTCTDFPTLSVSGTMGISQSSGSNATAASGASGVSGTVGFATGTGVPVTGASATSTAAATVLNTTTSTYHYIHKTSTLPPSYGFSIPAGTVSSAPRGTAASSLSQTVKYHNYTTTASTSPLGTAVSSLSHVYSFTNLNGTGVSTAPFGATGSSAPHAILTSSVVVTYSFSMPNGIASSAPLGTAHSSVPHVTTSSRVVPSYTFSSALNGTSSATAAATGSSMPVATSKLSTGQASSSTALNNTTSSVPATGTSSSMPLATSASSSRPVYSFSALNGTTSTAPAAATGSSIPIATSKYSTQHAHNSSASNASVAASTSSNAQAYSFTIPITTASSAGVAATSLSTNSGASFTNSTSSIAQGYSFTMPATTASSAGVAATNSRVSGVHSTLTVIKTHTRQKTSVASTVPFASTVSQVYSFSIQSSAISTAPLATSTADLASQTYQFSIPSSAASATVESTASTSIAQNSATSPPFYPMPSMPSMNMKRQVGATVTATIDGQVVTWVNTWGGELPTSDSVSQLTGSPVIVPTPVASPTITPSVTTLVSMTMSSGASSPSSVTVAAAPYPTCTGANSGAFTIDFDDLPTFSEPPQKGNASFHPPLFNPYNKLFWSQGWTYGPPPTKPYNPSSPPFLGAFVVDGNANVRSSNFTGTIPSGSDVNGMFGAGPRYENTAYWIDAYSALIGCTNFNDQVCEILLNGFGYDEETKVSGIKVQQRHTILPCESGSNCPLQEISFGSAFRNLTAVQIVATHPDSYLPVGYYIDDIKLAWSNSSCAASNERTNTSE